MTQVSNLSGPALDWAVGHAIGFTDDASLVLRVGPNEEDDPFNPSEQWVQGGPIIEREGIELTRCNDLYFPTGNEKGDHYEPYWEAKIDLNEGDVMVEKQYGPTPLIAAMRCYVASKLGESINLPEELQ